MHQHGMYINRRKREGIRGNEWEGEGKGREGRGMKEQGRKGNACVALAACGPAV